MIRKVALMNWRAYDRLELRLEEGTTFIVARNGVGKSSLMQAVAYGLYGNRAISDPASAIRAGSKSASVELEVTLPDGRTVQVRRTVEQRKATLEAYLEGKPLRDERQLDSLLSESNAADIDFLSRTTILQEGTVQEEASSSFSLYKHLCSVYGVENLLGAQDQLKVLRNESNKTVKGVRESAALSDKQLESLRAELILAQERSEASQARLVDKKATVESARAHHALARAWEVWHERRDERRDALMALEVDVHSLLSTSGQTDDLVKVLDAAEAQVQEEIDGVRRRRASIEGQLDAINSSLEVLATAEGLCPICQRPLQAADISHAEVEHRGKIEELSRELVSLETSELDFRLESVRALRRRHTAIPTLPSEPEAGPADPLPDLSSSESEYDAVSAEARDNQRAFDELHGRLLAAEEALRQRAEVERAYRREALIVATVEAVKAAADKVIEQSIDPLAEQIEKRWKRMFGDRGTLHLRSDGSLVLRRGDHELPFHYFSAGERMMAVLLTRITVLTASTRARMFWVDEPLEHLDPTYRRAVASMLAQATAPKGLRQVVVTTYEERIAEQLAQHVGDARLLVITN